MFITRLPILLNYYQHTLCVPYLYHHYKSTPIFPRTSSEPITVHTGPRLSTKKNRILDHSGLIPQRLKGYWLLVLRSYYG